MACSSSKEVESQTFKYATNKALPQLARGNDLRGGEATKKYWGQFGPCNPPADKYRGTPFPPSLGVSRALRTTFSSTFDATEDCVHSVCSLIFLKDVKGKSYSLHTLYESVCAYAVRKWEGETQEAATIRPEALHRKHDEKKPNSFLVVWILCVFLVSS